MNIKIKDEVLITSVDIDKGDVLGVNFRIVFTKPTDTIGALLELIRDLKPVKVKLSFDTLDCKED